MDKHTRIVVTLDCLAVLVLVVSWSQHTLEASMYAVYILFGIWLVVVPVAWKGFTTAIVSGKRCDGLICFLSAILLFVLFVLADTGMFRGNRGRGSQSRGGRIISYGDSRFIQESDHQESPHDSVDADRRPPTPPRRPSDQQ